MNQSMAESPIRWTAQIEQEGEEDHHKLMALAAARDGRTALEQQQLINMMFDCRVVCPKLPSPVLPQPQPQPRQCNSAGAIHLAYRVQRDPYTGLETYAGVITLGTRTAHDSVVQFDLYITGDDPISFVLDARRNLMPWFVDGKVPHITAVKRQDLFDDAYSPTNTVSLPQNHAWLV